MFKLLYVVIFLFILFEIEAKISDKRLCANENCMKPISHAKTILRYHTGAEGVLSFEANADVIVYSKSAGSNMELWGVEIKGVRGYVPKVYLRETRVLTKDPKFMLTTQEINQQVPSNETDTNSVIEPDKASDFTIVDGTTIYTDPDDAISPTPSSVVLPTSTVDNVAVRGDETNDNNLENDINNKETAPLGSRDSNVIDEKELGDKASENKNKEQTNENNLENNTNPEETTPLESRNNNVVNEKEWDDKGVEPETKESLTGQIVQKFINLIGGDKKEKEDEDDEQDDEEFDEDSEEVEDDEDDEEYDDSEEEGYVTDDLGDKSGENDEKGDKIPIEREEPALKDENLKIEDSAEERVKLRQLLSEKDKIEKTATEESDDGTKLESDDLNSIEDKREDPSSRESSEKDVEPSGNEQNISETVTEIPLTESPGYDLPIPRYDQDYVTPNPLETDPQKIPDENAATSSENLGETTDESTEDISEETGESANVAQEIKTDEITAQHTQNLETEAVQDQPKSDDTNVNIEVQEEKNPADLPQEDIKSVESQIESETTLENEIPKAEQIGDTEALKEDNIKSVDETKKSENLEDIKEEIIEEEKSTKPEEREITLTDIAEENAETVSGIFSGITNLFAGSSQNKIEEAPIQDKETKQEQNVDVEKEIRENVETNSADPQNVDQIVTHEHDLLSVLDSGKQDTSSMNEDQISQPPDVIADTPTIEYPLESVEKGYTPQDTLQEQNPQEYTPPDVLEDQSDIKDTLPKDDDLKDVEQKVLDVQEKEEYVPNLQEKENDGLPEENKVSDVQQKEEYIPVVQEKQSDDLGTFQKEDDATEATVVEAVPDVKENLGDIGDHIFDVHDQLLSKNSVEYGSCPAGESDCPTDISVVQKQLEMEEIVQAPFYGDFINLLTLLGVTGLSVALFLLGFIKIDKNRQESGLIAKINTLEKALLVASKENALLIDRVTEIQNETAAEHDRISSEEYDNLNKTYQDALTAKSSLEEQIQNLEKELENSTEVGLELNRMLSDIISSQNGSEILIANVEQLQRQLVEQQGTINTINDTLNLKDTENHELQLELEIKNKKVTHLQTELDKMAMNLFKVEEDKEQMQAKLEGEIIELKDQLEKNKNGFNSTRTSMLDEINSLKAKYGEIQRNLDVKISEYNILKDNFNQIKAIKNNSEALESLLNASSMKAELQQLQRDNQTLNDVLRQEQQTKFTLEKQIEIALQEAQSYRAKYDEADKEKLEARTKLEVLSNYFKEKEAQLQKELSKHESMWVEQQGEATSTVERIKYMQEELQNCKSQNELLKQEIVAQEVELKSQISVLEKKAHESWVSARQAERRLEDAKQEAAQLRNRLTLKERSYVEDKTQNRIQSPLEQNGDVAISPLHMPVETPASPPLLYGTRDHLTTSPPLPNLPPFLPPPPGVPFMPPPIPGVPGFMPPPPSMFPVDHRPPPLGRMSSPPPPMNSRYSPDSRYSPYDRNSPSPPYDDEYGSSPPPPMPMRGYSPYNRDDRRDFKRPPPPLRTNGRNKGAMSSGSGNSNESLEKISRHHSKV